jgi:riboflavin kinase/FMN adenylyltransferase
MAEPTLRRVVTIGTFDGVHQGHRTLLQKTRELAHASGWQSTVLTFPRPPQNYLGRPKLLLMPSEKRITFLRRHVEEVVVVDFPEIQLLSPREFVVSVLGERLHTAVVVVGQGFCFGRNRQGTVSTLMELGGELGMDVHVVDPVLVAGERVSSTAIRKALQVGDIPRAARLLGDPPRLWGRVVVGRGRGHTLGVPTANLSLDPELLVPAEGIYAARVFSEAVGHKGALYIGRRPTFDGGEISLEVHLLDIAHVDLYGRELEVHLLERLRADQRFATPEELEEQMRIDLEETRQFFSRQDA